MTKAWSRLTGVAGAHRSMSVLIGWALVGALLPLIIQIPPFSTFQRSSDWIGGFSNAGVFILLALGLNIVVGLAGLLDLGYAAFFAIGSYAYAFGASSFTGLHVPFWPMLLVGAFAAATFGILLGAPTLRLRGDYLAIVTLGFGEIVPAIFLNADTYTEGHEWHRRRGTARTGVREVQLQRPAPVLRHDGRHPRAGHGLRLSPAGLAVGPCLDGGSRG